MSITDELKKYAQSWREAPNLMDDLDAGDIDGLLGDIEHIADRIDAEHEEAIKQALMGEGGVLATDENMAEFGWVRMPEDADGKYWFCGDKIMLPDGNVVEVIGIGGDWLYYCVASVAATVFGRIRAHDKRHYHAPTVEDVLREFICDHEEDVRDEVDLIAEYAAKLMLKED